MRSVYITRPGATLKREGGLLRVTEKGKSVADITVHDLGQLVLMGNIMVTPGALDLLVDRGIDAVFLSTHGRYRGRFVHQNSSHISLRLAQYRSLLDPGMELGLARRIVETKIGNDRSFLMKFALGHII